MSYTLCAQDEDVHDHDLLPSLRGCARRPGLPGSQTACQVFLVSDSAGAGCDDFGSTFFLNVVIWRRSAVLVSCVEQARHGGQPVSSVLDGIL